MTLRFVLLMFPLLTTPAQVPPMPTPQEIVVPQTIRPLPGQLDSVLVFNSNSPELVQQEGILLSTFPPEGMAVPAAHLNVAFDGRFDVFAHHIARAATPEDLRTLYLGILLHNPGPEGVTVDILQAASYLSQPDAPFIDLPAYVDNARGEVYAGPGSRVMSDLLRGQRQAEFPPQIVIPPGASRLLLNLPIPVKMLEPPINGRSTAMRLVSSGRVYAASLAQFAPVDAAGMERAPTLTEWENQLRQGGLAGPRDRAPTPPEQTTGQIIYGRVAGVSQGARWQAQVVDKDEWTLQTPPTGEAFSYGLSTLRAGTHGTGQIQTAPMVARYPDTAYEAHGNYAVEYRLTLPLFNATGDRQRVAILLETPIKEEQPKLSGSLRFFDPLPRQVFFRGTVRLRYKDDQGLPRTRYVHLVQRRGQRGMPLIELNMPPGDRRLVQFDFLYPPDATPPQVMTVMSQPG